MGELAANRPEFLELVGPRDDKADASTAAARIGLVGRERRVGDLRPTHRINRRAAPGADPSLALDIELDRQPRQSCIAPVEMQCAHGSGGVGAAIVGRENKDRIVELAEFREQCHEAADILVGVGAAGRRGHRPRQVPPDRAQIDGCPGEAIPLPSDARSVRRAAHPSRRHNDPDILPDPLAWPAMARARHCWRYRERTAWSGPGCGSR